MVSKAFGINMSDNGIERLDSGLLVVRNDGFLSNAIENSSLYNSSTGFGTATRDSSTQTRVGPGYVLGEQELRWLYRSSWFIRRVCDLPAQDMTKKTLQIILDDSDEQDVKSLMARWRTPVEDVSPFSKRASYGFDQAKEQAEKWARQFGSAYIVLQLNGGEDLEQPLTEVRSVDGLAVLDAYSLRPSNIDFNRSDPEFYQLIYDRDNCLEAKLGQRIHESRVLPYYGNPIHPYDQKIGNAVADSVIQAMWGVFMAHGEVKGTIQEAIKSFSLLTVSISNLSGLLSAGKGKEVQNFLKEVGFQKSVYQILVTDPEASKTGFEGRNLTGVRDNFEIFREELTAASGLPFYKIWGTLGRAGLSDSGSNEARAYAEQISTLQRSRHLSNDERIIKVLCSLVFGDPYKPFQIKYPSIHEETEQEQLEGQKVRAEIYQIYSTLPNAVTTDEFRRAIATNEPLESVMQLEELASSPDSQKDDSMPGIVATRRDKQNEIQFSAIANEHNSINHGAHQYADVQVLETIYQRGLESHRNDSVSPDDWAMGRVRAFLRLLATGKPKNKKYTDDNDLLPASHKRSSRVDEAISISGSPLPNGEWDEMASVGDVDVLSVIEEALG